jgi:hypothetical protein
MSKTIGIVGSRRRNTQQDYEATLRAFKEIFEAGDRVVSGGCPRGGDNFAEVIAKKLGLTITIHYPDWDGVGRSAGFLRNTKIAEDADILIAVVAQDRRGGTEDTIRKFEFLGKSRLVLA